MVDKNQKQVPNNVHHLPAKPGQSKPSGLIESLQPEIEIPGCPPHLLKEAKKEWKRITPELEKYGLISKLDRAALAGYCEQWALVVYAETRLKRAMEMAAKAEATALEKGEEYAGGDGLVLVTTNGNQIYSPYWVIMKNSRYVLDKMLSNFGLSPAARGRVNPSQRLQKELFVDDSGGGFSNL